MKYLHCEYILDLGEIIARYACLMNIQALVFIIFSLFLGPREVCYGEVGCFPLRSYCGEDIFLPQPPEHIDTTFLLYTANQTGQAITYHMRRAQFFNRGFNSSLETKIIIHGFIYSANGAGITDIRDAFLAQVSRISMLNLY